MTYQPKVYKTPGGAKLVIASDGIIDIESGGLLKIAGVTVTASAADLNTASGGSTGTTSSVWTLDSDSSTAKLAFDTNSATGNFTATIAPDNLTGDITLTLPATTGTLALTTDVGVDIDAGSSGTPGSLDIFPTTVANGKLTLTATNMGGAWNMGITNKAIAAARAYTIPDAGGDGQFVMTTEDNECLIDVNSSDRAVSLSGDLTIAGDVTTTGAGANIIAFGGANTYTFPDATGTIALDNTASTGTTNASYTINSDAVDGTLVVRTNAVGGTNHAVTLSAATTTQAVALTLPNVASDTLVAKTTTDTLTNKTLTDPVINGVTTAAAANDIDWSTSTGAWDSPTGTCTFNGNTAGAANVTFDWSASSGTFQTSTGATAFNGDITIAAGKDITISAGDSLIDWSVATGTFQTPTGAHTINGAVTLAANKGIAMTAGNAAIDYSLGTGFFKSTSGTNTLGGNTIIADGKTLSVGTATGGVANAVSIFSATAANGSIVLHQPDNAGNFSATIQPDAALGQGTTYQLPDPGGANGEVVVTTGSNQLLVNCNAGDRTASLAGNVTLAGALTTVGAFGLTLTQTALTDVTLPTSGTLATIGGVETLTNKVIDGDDNTLQDISPTVAKALVANTTPSIPFVLQFAPIITSGTLTYTVPAGKTLRVLDAVIYKTAEAGSADDTLTIKNAGAAITDDISLNLADKLVARPASLDDANHDVAAGAALQVVTVKGGGDGGCSSLCTVYGAWV